MNQLWLTMGEWAASVFQLKPEKQRHLGEVLDRNKLAFHVSFSTTFLMTSCSVIPSFRAQEFACPRARISVVVQRHCERVFGDAGKLEVGSRDSRACCALAPRCGDQSDGDWPSAGADVSRSGRRLQQCR